MSFDPRDVEAAFSKADAAHFAWQTRHPVVAQQEARLVRDAFMPLGERVLDVGCGEGATLLHLGCPRGAVGVDLFDDKLAFATENVPGCTFVRGSAYELPFEDGRFDHVLLRDVIHHLETPDRAIAEIARVLSPGGRVDVLEPCRYNPLVAAHAIVTPVERGELRSTVPFLRALLEPAFSIERVERAQPMPLHRVVFHPVLGRPSFANAAWVRAGVGAVERAAGWLMPRTAWAYLSLRATKL